MVFSLVSQAADVCVNFDWTGNEEVSDIKMLTINKTGIGRACRACSLRCVKIINSTVWHSLADVMPRIKQSLILWYASKITGNAYVRLCPVSKRTFRQSFFFFYVMFCKDLLLSAQASWWYLIMPFNTWEWLRKGKLLVEGTDTQRKFSTFPSRLCLFFRIKFFFLHHGPGC